MPWNLFLLRDGCYNLLQGPQPDQNINTAIFRFYIGVSGPPTWSKHQYGDFPILYWCFWAHNLINTSIRLFSDFKLRFLGTQPDQHVNTMIFRFHIKVSGHTTWSKHQCVYICIAYIWRLIYIYLEISTYIHMCMFLVLFLCRVSLTGELLQDGIFDDKPIGCCCMFWGLVFRKSYNWICNGYGQLYGCVWIHVME